ncbi:uncharacterized protein LOC120343183 isoform X1 [Styela clava]
MKYFEKMCEYPSFVFPTHTRGYSKHNQQAFTDYGCWESVDIDVDENESQVIVRKHRSQHTSDSTLETPLSKTIDSRVLTPTHDFFTLGKPAYFPKLIEDDITFAKLFKERVIFEQGRKRSHKDYRKDSSHILTIPVEKYINNLIEDHPDITGQCFDEIIQPIINSLPSRKKKKRFRRHMYLKHIDPSLCDVGTKLLRDIVRKESQTEILKRYCDRDYSGGCLSYSHIGKRNGKQYGILVCPQGQCLDELCIKSLTIDMKNGLENDVDSQGSSVCNNQGQNLFPKLLLGSEIHQSLNGRILQIDVTCPETADNFLICARSDYHVLLNKFDSHQLEWNDEEDRASFSNDTVPLSSLGLLKTSGSSHISSIALSPFIPGECVVATADRCVRMWTPDADKSPNMASQGSIHNLEILLNGTMGGLRSSNTWRQVCFAAHPRQIYITDDENVCLFDIRTQNSYRSLFNVHTSKHAKEHEKIYAIESCRRIENDYECLIATNYNLYLFDQRHCGQPLMQWGTNMTFPPQYVKISKVCQSSIVDEVYPDIAWSQSTSAILVGNQNAHEVYCYQMCKSRKTTSKVAKIYPPQAVGPPRILGSFKNIKNYLDRNLYEHGAYLKNRASKMTVGLDAVSLEGPGNGIIVFQMNAVGDIGYQTLAMKNHQDVYDLSNVITGKTSATFTSFEEEHNKELLCNMKKKNYDDWIHEVTCTGTDQHRKNTVMKKHLLPHKEARIEKRFFSNVLFKSSFIVDTDSLSMCPLCTTHVSSVNSSTEPDDSSTSTFCLSCCTSIKGSNAILELLRNPEHTVLTRSLVGKIEIEDNDISSDSDSETVNIRNLNLLNIQHTGEDIDNEVGRILKATWKGTYQDYWESLKQLEMQRRQEEQNEQDRQTFDLSQRSITEDQEENNTTVENVSNNANASFLSILSRKTKPTEPRVSPKRKKRKKDISSDDHVIMSSPVHVSHRSLTATVNSDLISSQNQPSMRTTLPLPDISVLTNTTSFQTGSSGGVLTSANDCVAGKSLENSPFSFFSPRRGNLTPQHYNVYSPSKHKGNESQLRSPRVRTKDGSPTKHTRKKAPISQAIGF